MDLLRQYDDGYMGSICVQGKDRYDKRMWVNDMRTETKYFIFIFVCQSF